MAVLFMLTVALICLIGRMIWVYTSPYGEKDSGGEAVVRIPVYEHAPGGQGSVWPEEEDDSSPHTAFQNILDKRIQ